MRQISDCPKAIADLKRIVEPGPIEGPPALHSIPTHLGMLARHSGHWAVGYLGIAFWIVTALDFSWFLCSGESFVRFAAHWTTATVLFYLSGKSDIALFRLFCIAVSVAWTGIRAAYATQQVALFLSRWYLNPYCDLFQSFVLYDGCALDSQRCIEFGGVYRLINTRVLDRRFAGHTFGRSYLGRIYAALRRLTDSAIDAVPRPH